MKRLQVGSPELDCLICYVLDANSGKVRTSFPISGPKDVVGFLTWGFYQDNRTMRPARTRAIACDSQVIVSATEDSLWCYDLQSGERVWARGSEAEIHLPFLYSDILQIMQRGSDLILSRRDGRALNLDTNILDANLLMMNDGTLLCIRENRASVFDLRRADWNTRPVQEIDLPSKDEIFWWAQEGRDHILFFGSQRTPESDLSRFAVIDKLAWSLVGEFTLTSILRDHCVAGEDFYGLLYDGTVFRAPLEKLINPN